MNVSVAAVTEMAKELLVVLLMVLGLGTGAVAAPATTTAPHTAVAPSPDAFYDIHKVVDGDTISIDMGGHKQTIRLIGLNTPETVDPRRPVQCFGKEASDKAKELLTGHQVRVETDMSQGMYDKYGRLLAYVYRDDGLLINKYLIEEGYGYEYTYNTPYEFQKQFKQAQRDAQDNERGLWAPGVCANK